MGRGRLFHPWKQSIRAALPRTSDTPIQARHLASAGGPRCRSSSARSCLIASPSTFQRASSSRLTRARTVCSRRCPPQSGLSFRSRRVEPRSAPLFAAADHSRKEFWLLSFASRVAGHRFATRCVCPHCSFRLDGLRLDRPKARCPKCGMRMTAQEYGSLLACFDASLPA